jgi:hypothetical protein
MSVFCVNDNRKECYDLNQLNPPRINSFTKYKVLQNVQYEYEYTGGLYNFNCTGQFQLVGSILNGLESTHELFPFDSFSLFDQLTD